MNGDCGCAWHFLVADTHWKGVILRWNTVSWLLGGPSNYRLAAFVAESSLEATRRRFREVESRPIPSVNSADSALRPLICVHFRFDHRRVVLRLTEEALRSAQCVCV